MAKAAPAPRRCQRPAAMLLGVVWVNPLMWRDYPTHWNLLWAQGLAKPNDNDKEAARFTLGQAVGELLPTLGEPTIWNPEPKDHGERYEALGDLLRIPVWRLVPHYARLPHYFYSVRNGTSRPDFMDQEVIFGMSNTWLNTPTFIEDYEKDDEIQRSLDYQRAMGVPAPSLIAYDEDHANERMWFYYSKIYRQNGTGRLQRGTGSRDIFVIGERTLTLAAANRMVFKHVYAAAECRSMILNPNGKMPITRVYAGHETAGFHNLRDAIEYLNEHPNKTVWVWNVDAPNYPSKEKQTNENSAILILGHPSADWGYAPLAALYTPQQHTGGVDSKAANPGGAWNTLLDVAQAQAPSDHPIERIYHDVDRRDPNVVPLVSPLRQAVWRHWPDLDPLKSIHSVSEVMSGPARAASFAVNVAMAAAYVDQSGHSAVVASAAQPDEAWSVLVAPPPGWLKPAPVGRVAARHGREFGLSPVVRATHLLSIRFFYTSPAPNRPAIPLAISTQGGFTWLTAFAPSATPHRMAARFDGFVASSDSPAKALHGFTIRSVVQSMARIASRRSRGCIGWTAGPAPSMAM